MNWITTVNSLPITSPQELREQIEPLLLDPTNLDPLVDLLVAAGSSERPSEMLEPWIEHEPAITGSIGFLLPPSAHGAAAPPPGRGGLVAALEATALGNFVAGLGDHFIITGDRSIAINHESPPTLDQAYEAVRRMLETRNTLERVDNFTTWTMGALLDECDNLWGDDFDLSEIAGQTDKAYNTLVTSLNVYRAFKVQRFNVTFTHHKEIYYSTIPDEAKMAILATSERLAMSTAEQRKVTSYTRKMGLPEGLEDYATKEELLERVTIRDTSQKFLFTYQGTTYTHQGASDAIPRGATGIINLDSLEELNPAGNRKIENWRSVGIAVDTPPDWTNPEEMVEVVRADTNEPVVVEVHTTMPDGTVQVEYTPPPLQEPQPQGTLTQERLEEVYRELTTGDGIPVAVRTADVPPVEAQAEPTVQQLIDQADAMAESEEIMTNEEGGI